MIYYKNKSLLIRSMEKEDARIFNETYLSYGWHPSLEIYENYLHYFLYLSSNIFSTFSIYFGLCVLG